MHGGGDDEHRRAADEVDEGRREGRADALAQPSVGGLLPRDADAGDDRHDQHPPRHLFEHAVLQGDADGDEGEQPADQARHRDRHDAGGSVAGAVEDEPRDRLSGDDADGEQRHPDDRDGETLRGHGERPGDAAGEHPPRDRAVSDAGAEAAEPAAARGQDRGQDDEEDEPRAERDRGGDETVTQPQPELAVDARLEGRQDADDDRTGQRHPGREACRGGRGHEDPP